MKRFYVLIAIMLFSLCACTSDGDESDFGASTELSENGFEDVASEESDDVSGEDSKESEEDNASDEESDSLNNEQESEDNANTSVASEQEAETAETNNTSTGNDNSVAENTEASQIIEDNTVNTEAEAQNNTESDSNQQSDTNVAEESNNTQEENAQVENVTDNNTAQVATEGISMSVSYAGSGNCNLSISNNSGAEIDFGDEYRVERLDGGNWIRLDFPDGGVWAAVLRVLQNGETHSETIDPGSSIPIEAGNTYRIVKVITAGGQDMTLYAQFDT